jgi:uncharacterized protein YqeY
MLITQLHKDLAASMKRGDTSRVEILRLILSELHNTAIAKYGKLAEAKVNDADVVTAVKILAKRHRESIIAFEKGNRPDLVAKEKEQLVVVQEFLPKELADAEIRNMLTLLAASGEKNFGVLMGTAMEKLKGKADGGRVATLLKEMMDRQK